MPTDLTIHANGLRFHLRTWGEPERPPVILLHGLASTHHMFDLLAPLLVDKYYLVAPDQRGHGGSDKPETGYEFADLADDLDALIDTMGLSGRDFHLVGHSWGAWTALYYGAHRRTRATHIALIDGGVQSFRSLYPTWQEAQIAMSPPDYGGKTADDILRMVREGWLKSFYRPEIEPLALSVFDLSDPRRARAHLPRAQHMQIARAIWEARPEAWFGQVSVPLLAVLAVPAGADPEPSMVEAASLLERSGDNRRVVWMRETAHDIPWHRPAELADLLRAFFDTQASFA